MVDLTSFPAPFSKSKLIHFITYFYLVLSLSCLLQSFKPSTTEELKEGEGALHQVVCQEKQGGVKSNE